jgi:serine/threonine-protein kinase
MPPSGAENPVVRPAFVVDRYAVYDEFAAGGMATVHFARLNGAQGFRRTVAVKRLLPHLIRDRDLALMLIDEARLAARVRHPNVVSTLDVVETRSELLLVMDYVHGDSLAKLTRWSSTGIPFPIATAIVTDALHGLHAAHEARDVQGRPLGLVHRDVSPQNILVGLDGVTRIVDFGIAKAAGRAHTTQDGAVKGKLSYMAPEQLGRGDVTRATDVFAASVVLWELLTGLRLFAGSSHAEIVFKVMSAPIVAPSALQVALPAELERVLMRGLQRDPAQRFASAREMALALEGSAPSVRPSEVAAWVEQAVGERLSSRTSLLHAIERADHESDTQANTMPRVIHEDSPAPARSSDRSAGDVSEVVAIAGPRHAKRAWIGLALCALIASVWLLRDDSVRHEEAPSAKVARPEAPPIEPAPAPAPVVEPVREVVDASVQAPPSRPRSRSPRAARPNCDPPYAIDSAGRVLFKAECMK